MKILLATLGAAALKILFMVAITLVYGLLLWLLVPLVLPGVSYGFTNGVALAALVFVAKAIFK